MISCGLKGSGECEAVFWKPNQKWVCPVLDSPCDEFQSSDTSTKAKE